MDEKKSFSVERTQERVEMTAQLILKLFGALALLGVIAICVALVL